MILNEVLTEELLQQAAAELATALIIDGSNDKKVYSTDGHDETNYALTKDDFVQHIIDNDPGFDMFSFEGFRPTLEIIKSIVEDADRN